MALFTTYVQNGAYNAPDDRFSQAATLARLPSRQVKPGVIGASTGDGRVRQSSTAGRNVTVDPFTAVVSDGARGAYIGGIDASVVKPILTPEASNNRSDLLCWRPLEGLNVDSNGASTLGSVTLAGDDTAIQKQVVSGELYWVKGAPSSSTSPPLPAIPVGSVPLARVYVAGGTSTITTANITDARQWTTTAGGLQFDTAAQAYGTASDYVPGTTVYNHTSGDHFIVSKTNQLLPIMTEPSWTSFPATFLTSAGTPTVGNGVLNARYLRMGKLVHARFHFVSGTTSNWGIGPIKFGGLPFPGEAGWPSHGTAVAYSDGAEWQGFCRLPNGAKTLEIYMPFSDTSNKMYPIQNSDGSGSAGTGIPRKAGSYSFGAYHTITADITYEVS